eukprot:gene4056-4714_t
MEECPPLSAGADPEVENTTQKPVDPSSMSIVYSWMISVLASVISYNSPQVSPKENKKLEIIEDKENTFIKILPPCKKTLILDLDETLVHSTLVPVSNHHLTVNVVVEDVECTFYVIKRPHVDYFIEKVAEWYDVVIFTASMKDQYERTTIDEDPPNRVMY